MLPVTINAVDYRLDVVRYPDNSTDFIISTADAVLGVFALRLMPSNPSPTFVVGQALPAGMESLLEGTTTRIVNDTTFAVNCVYQLNLVSRTDAVVLDNDTAGQLLVQAVANLSGYKGDVDTLMIMAIGDIQGKRVGNEIHYMVGDVVFSKATAPQ
jgi:hypothetical protein